MHYPFRAGDPSGTPILLAVGVPLSIDNHHMQAFFAVSALLIQLIFLKEASKERQSSFEI
jgi:hypothetical protein